ncbi:MAG: branched-chain amino acid ABC transporter permease [Geminicoccaceae bacterium]
MASLSPALASLFPGLLGVFSIAAYLTAFLHIESQTGTALLIFGAMALIALLVRFNALDHFQRSFADREKTMNAAIVVAVIVLALVFHEDHFTLLLIATVMIYMTASLGLTVQFGYAGVLNFAGASFFGIGCYTSAVLTDGTNIPEVLIIVAGGIMAALVGVVLLLPVLRTRGHYSAVITIAFALLFKTFLEVNDVLGGPQGLSVGSMNFFGWDFNQGIEIGEAFEASFYLNYVLASLVLLCLAFAFVRRLDRSWIGLNMDAIRLDETAAACFGYNITRWKVTAFMIGNAIAGMAGALYAMMLGFIAPTNFDFGASLILVSIVLFGGIGNPWGVAVATLIVVLLPEKLQILQEYRFLIYATLVILVLLFRPDGLLPRPVRAYFAGRVSS